MDPGGGTKNCSLQDSGSYEAISSQNFNLAPPGDLSLVLESLLKYPFAREIQTRKFLYSG